MLCGVVRRGRDDRLGGCSPSLALPADAEGAWPAGHQSGHKVVGERWSKERMSGFDPVRQQGQRQRIGTEPCTARDARNSCTVDVKVTEQSRRTQPEHRLTLGPNNRVGGGSNLPSNPPCSLRPGTYAPLGGGAAAGPPCPSWPMVPRVSSPCDPCCSGCWCPRPLPASPPSPATTTPPSPTAPLHIP